MNETQAAPMTGAAKNAASPLRSLPVTWWGELRALLGLGWPLVVAQLAQNALLTTDVIMMGWLGPKYLAAGALANSLFIAAQLFGVGVAGAVAPMVAQALGGRDVKSVRRTVRQGIWMAVVLAAIITPLIWNVRPVYALLGQDPELTGMAETFIHYAVGLLLPAFLIIVFRSFLSAHGATRAILLITVAGVFVNAACNYALMFGNWGFPRLELAGAGIATTTVNVVMLLLMVAYTLTHRRFRRYRIFHRFFEADWQRFRQLWAIGLPIGFMLLAEVGLFTFASLLQGRIGEPSLAAHSIALQLASIAFMVPLGLSQASTVRVGLALGEGNREGVRKAGWTALFVTLAFMSCTALLFTFNAPALVGLFLDRTDPGSSEVLTLAASFLLIAALFQLFDGTQAAMGAALRGLSDTNMPLIIALVGYWAVGFPFAWFMGFPMGFNGLGVWLGLAAGLAVVAIVLTIRFALRDRLGLTTRAVA